jgi:hypothetical protein
MSKWHLNLKEEPIISITTSCMLIARYSASCPPLPATPSMTGCDSFNVGTNCTAACQANYTGAGVHYTCVLNETTKVAGWMANNAENCVVYVKHIKNHSLESAYIILSAARLSLSHSRCRACVYAQEKPADMQTRAPIIPIGYSARLSLPPRP